MGYSAKVGSFNIDTSASATVTQSISGVGFQPKVVLLWYGGGAASSDTCAGGTINMGMSAGTSSSARYCAMSISEDGQTDSDALRSWSTSEVIRCYTDTGTLDGLMDFSSLDADGFTLVVDDQFTQPYRVSYLALGGDDLASVKVGNFQAPDTAGSYAVTGVGFQPTAVIFFNACYAYVGTGNDLMLSFGMATGSSNQGVVNGYSYDAQATTVTTGYGYNRECVARQNVARDAFVEFTADGFNLNRLEGTYQYYVGYVALSGGQYSVGELTTRTDGNDIVEDVGFQPTAILFMSANRAHSTQDTPTAHVAFSVGAATTADERACHAVWDENGLADSECAYANYDSAVYARMDDDAITALMDVKSIDSSGFTCVMDDAEDVTGCWVTYLAIGATAVGLAANPVRFPPFNPLGGRL